MPGNAAQTHLGTSDRVISVAINASSSGNNTIVASVAGRRIVVTKYKIVAAGAVTVTFESSGGTVLDGPCAYAANGGVCEPDSENGHFSTLPGEALVLNLSGAVQVGGHVKYAVV
jgi:hypothetical protein